MRKVAAIILAAGESSRFGKSKQLLSINGKSLLERIVHEALEANCSPTLVILGADAEEMEREIDATRAVVIKNEYWKRGIATSIRVAIQNLIENARRTDAAILLVCDQPFVDARIIRGLIELHEKTQKPIVASSYAGTLGVPALFDRSCFNGLLALEEESGAKSLILSKPDDVAVFQFPGGEIDIDTAEDWQAFLQNEITVCR